ncbi:MAG: hypothetical protein J7L53_11670 [Deltaproteobacteria bacterium]|nr:hypothetical protein [Deltaproteobacteria bacterium]
MNSKIIALYLIPITAGIICMALFFINPYKKDFVLDRPNFLSNIDQLSVCSQDPEDISSKGNIKDVFCPSKESASKGSTYSRYPIRISLIVNSPKGGYVILNGKKMYVGDSYRGLTITSVRSDSVTVRYNNGVKETIYVKIY